MRKPSFARALIVLVTFVGIQAASSWPQFHRHGNELGRAVAHSTANLVAVSPADGEPGCPACALLAVSTIPSVGSEAPRSDGPGVSINFQRSIETAFRASLTSRGRAPPLG